MGWVMPENWQMLTRVDATFAMLPSHLATWTENLEKVFTATTAEKRGQALSGLGQIWCKYLNTCTFWDNNDISDVHHLVQGYNDVFDRWNIKKTEITNMSLQESMDTKVDQGHTACQDEYAAPGRTHRLKLHINQRFVSKKKWGRAKDVIDGLAIKRQMAAKDYMDSQAKQGQYYVLNRELDDPPNAEESTQETNVIPKNLIGCVIGLRGKNIRGLETELTRCTKGEVKLTMPERDDTRVETKMTVHVKTARHHQSELAANILEIINTRLAEYQFYQQSNGPPCEWYTEDSMPIYPLSARYDRMGFEKAAESPTRELLSGRQAITPVLSCVSLGFAIGCGSWAENHTCPPCCHARI
jgi:hypothetical protein